MIRVAASELLLTPHARQRFRERANGIDEAELRTRVLDQLRAGDCVLSEKTEHVYVTVAGLSAVVRIDPPALVATIYELEDRARPVLSRAQSASERPSVREKAA